MTDDEVRPRSIIAEWKKNGVTHLVWLPDSETNFMYKALLEDGTIEQVPVSREGEAFPIALGLWMGGKTPLIMVQNSGFFESGDALRGLVLDTRVPLVTFIGFRGYNRFGPINDSAAHFLIPILHTWGMVSYLVEREEDAPRISHAFQEAERRSYPVAVLVPA